MLKVHFDLTISVNDNDYRWSEPRTSEDMDFDMPIGLFNEKNFSTVVSNIVKRLVEKYPEAVEKYNEEQDRIKEELMPEDFEEEGE